ncbi:MAG: hypothetical protein AAF490_25950 [Chloroflexota bacterium]
MSQFRRLEINGGHVQQNLESTTSKLSILPAKNGYTNSQIDDYRQSENGRSHFKWQPNTTLSLSARFSRPISQLKGTAGFGFWNAPFGDPTVKTPAIPKAVWFFFGSQPNRLPFYKHPTENGFIAGTIHATRWQALRWIPFAPFVLAINNISSVKHRLWPKVQSDLGIYSTLIQTNVTQWHHYKLDWGLKECKFWLDEELIHASPVSPTGKLGFVCWIDNQYLVATGNGRFRWGTVPITQSQTLEIADLSIKKGIKVKSKR